MRVTLKTVNEKLSSLGTKTELAKGAGYFLFRGEEADEWIDRTVRVPTISSLTLDQWIDEYQRLKTLNDDMMKATRHAPPKAAKPEKAHAAKPEKPRHQEPPPEPTPPEPCRLKAEMLADVDQAHKSLVEIEEQRMRAAREDKFSEFVHLSAAANRQRGNFDRVLLAFRDHAVAHRC